MKMTEKHPNDNVAARRRKLDDLFSDQPYLSATMRAHRLHERSTAESTSLQMTAVADEEDDEEMLLRLSESRRERRLSSLWEASDSESLLPAAVLATTLNPDMGYSLESAGPASGTGALAEHVTVPHSGQVRLNLLLDLGSGSAHDRVRLRSADAEVLTAKEAAGFMKVSEDTLRTWTQRRGLPCARIGRQLRFRRAALIEWLSAQEGK
jgi:excisionase family DNA binding protein